MEDAAKDQDPIDVSPAPADGTGTYSPPRSHPRFARRRPVVLLPMGESPVYGRLEVLGACGALLRCPRCFEVGERLDLSICLAGARIPAKARVRYVEPDDDGDGYALGVEFRYLGEDGRQLLDSVLARSD